MRRIALVGLLVLVAVGSLPAVAQVPEAGLPACGRPLENLPPGAPRNVELATVTDTEFVVTWLTCDEGGHPLPSDSVVAYGEIGGGLGLSVPEGPAGTRPTAFHHVRVSGLKPGTIYRYEVSSGGLPAIVDRLNPGVFQTLTPPPGRELFRLGVLADTHLGETTSGLATSNPFDFPPSYRSDRPYAEVMARAAVAGLKRERVTYSILPADNSTHGERHDLAALASVLRPLRGRVLVARGAHDRANQYDRSRAECGPDGDCFRLVFRRGERAGPEPVPRPRAVVHRGWTLIALDSANPESGAGELDAAQLEWLRDRLEAAEAKGRPSMVFFHHPVAHYSTTLAIPPAIFGVNQQDANDFLELIADYDVRLVISAHTHRNWVAYDPRTGSVPLIEVGPAKEYPAGYTLIRVFEGGILRTWIPIDCLFCNAWRETTRGEYFALYPLYTTGSIRDRNFVHTFDDPDVMGVPSIPLGPWPPFLCRV